MEQRISIVTLGVGDLEKSRAFFNALGWNETDDSSEQIAFFNTGGVLLALYPKGLLADDIGDIE